MRFLRAIAGFTDNHIVAVTGIISVSLFVIAVWNTCALESDRGHWMLMLAQSIGVVLSATWLIDAPRFRDSLDFKSDLFDCEEFADLHKRYKSRMRLFIRYEPKETHDQQSGDGEEAPQVPFKERVCQLFKAFKALLPRLLLLAVWSAVGFLMSVYILDVTDDLWDRVLLIAPMLAACILNLVSFYLCFVYAQLIAETANLAVKGALPFYWSQPSKTPGYVYLKRVSRQLNVCFLIASLLFVCFVLSLTMYAKGFDFSFAFDPSASQSQAANPLIGNFIFISCFSFTVLLGVVAFLALHFMSRINLNAMLDAWEQKTLDSVMPAASFNAAVERSTGKVAENSLDDVLELHERLNDAMRHVTERPGFDSADAASLVLALLTLLVAIATFAQAAFD